jgi:hypothetical protein
VRGARGLSFWWWWTGKGFNFRQGGTKHTHGHGSKWTPLCQRVSDTLHYTPFSQHPPTVLRLTRMTHADDCPNCVMLPRVAALLRTVCGMSWRTLRACMV